MTRSRRQDSGFKLIELLAVFSAFILVCGVPQTCLGWFEGGHHLIVEMAYDLLSEAEQQQIQKILAMHPRFSEDFVVPPNVVEPEANRRWVVGRAGYWPDVARAFPDWNRPSWHYQLGSTLTIGDVVPPKHPGPVPADANLGTQELHVAQAIELCRKVLRDKSRPAADRAIAICWIEHLVADSHQPCHSGSLYVAGLFPDGDRGANLITTKQAKTLHLFWDALLGSLFDADDLQRRMVDIKSDKSLWDKSAEAAKKPGGLDPLTWLAESADYGRSHVYAPDVLSAVEAARRSGSQVVEVVDLSDEYQQAAAELARVRAAFAARRLAAVLHEGL